MGKYLMEILPEDSVVMIKLIGYDVWLTTLTKAQASIHISNVKDFQLAKRTEKERIQLEENLKVAILCPVCNKLFNDVIVSIKHKCPKCKAVFFEVSQ